MKKSLKLMALMITIIQFILMMPQIEFSNYEVNAIENALELRPIVEAPIVNVDEPFKII